MDEPTRFQAWAVEFLNWNTDVDVPIQELIDRLDGKAAQSITGIEGDPITLVQRVIVQQVTESGEVEPLTIEQPPVKTIN